MAANHGIKETINFVNIFVATPIFITTSFNIYKYNKEGEDFTNSKIPVPYAINITCGKFHILILSLTGQVYSYGLNNHGQLGLGHNENLEEWIAIPNLNNVIKIAAGDCHSLFLTADEKVYACGKNDRGQLGLGHTNNVNMPTLVIDLKQ